MSSDLSDSVVECSYHERSTRRVGKFGRVGGVNKEDIGVGSFYETPSSSDLGLRFVDRVTMDVTEPVYEKSLNTKRKESPHLFL